MAATNIVPESHQSAGSYDVPVGGSVAQPSVCQRRSGNGRWEPVKFLDVELTRPDCCLYNRGAVAAYLGACGVLAVDECADVDALSPDSGEPVPVGIATDGTFAWPLHLEYYVRRYGVKLPDEFLAHVQALGFWPNYVLPGHLEQLRWQLFRPSHA